MDNGGFPAKFRRDCRWIEALATLASQLHDRRNDRHTSSKRQAAPIARSADAPPLENRIWRFKFPYL